MELDYIKIEDSLLRNLNNREILLSKYKVNNLENLELINTVIERSIDYYLSINLEKKYWGYITVDENEKSFVGTCSYNNRPSDAENIEISYFTFPGFEHNGYATQMVNYLTDFAFKNFNVKMVAANTLPVKGDSPSILLKQGFDLKGTIFDKEDGPVWRWEKQKSI